ncbi:MAG: hypothetical protein WCO57_17120 [Verrucomicrobiota bacterium]
MAEVQKHGFSFEEWVRNILFEDYSGSYMQKWDVPLEHNRHKAISRELHHVPVSIKTAKFRSPIGLGDVLRQRHISEPFMMIVGFWRQRTPSEKWFEDISYAMVSPTTWNFLWGSLRRRKEIKFTDAVI